MILVKSLHMKLLWYLFTYCQSFPNFCNLQTVISITVSYPGKIVHRVYSNGISCLSICDQSGGEWKPTLSNVGIVLPISCILVFM